jgi:hypothetical protein
MEDQALTVSPIAFRNAALGNRKPTRRFFWRILRQQGIEWNGATS